MNKIQTEKNVYLQMMKKKKLVATIIVQGEMNPSDFGKFGINEISQ